MDPLRPAPRCRHHCCSGSFSSAGPAAGASPGRAGRGSTAQVGAKGGGLCLGTGDHPGLPWLGETLAAEGELCFGEVSFGGGQPSPGVSVLGVYSSGPSDGCCRLPAPMDSRVWGHSPACSPHNASGGAASLLGAVGRAVSVPVA